MAFFLESLISTAGFPPRWYCGTAWTPLLGWTHITSDFLIFLAYFSIPLTLLYFLYKRRDVPFNYIFLLFIFFILLCGLCHLVEAIIFWHPIYRFAGVLKAITAFVSLLTATALFIVLPKFLNLPKYAEIRSFLASIVDHSKDIIISFDRLGVISSINKSGEKILCCPQDQYINTNIADFPLKILPLEASKNTIDSFLQDKVSRYNLTLVINKKTHHFSSTISPIKNANGELIGLSILMIDTTEKDLIREDLEIACDDLKVFSYALSHDLKAPLRGINTLSKMINDNPANTIDEESRSHLAMIQDLSQQIQKQNEDLLKIAGLREQECDYAPIFFEDLVNNTLMKLDTQIQKEGVRINLVNIKNHTLYCNSTLMEEVLQNLIINALKYNDKEIKEIEIGVVHNPEQADTTFYVKDNGIGFKESQQHKIFHHFTRLHNKKEYGGGSGIGLGIVKKIIDKHRGEITVTSQEKSGATFFIQVPSAPNIIKKN